MQWPVIRYRIWFTFRNIDFQQSQDFLEGRPERPPKATKGEMRTHSQYRTAKKGSNDTSENCQELPVGTSKPQLAERWVWQKAKTKSLGFTSRRGTSVEEDISLRNQSNAPACCSSKTSGQKCCLLNLCFLSKALEIDVGLGALVTINCTSASSMP